MQPNYRIDEYVAADGTAPLSSWLSQLSDLRAKSKIGVMEMIVDTGPGYRVYLAAVGLQALVLLAGGSKRSQRRDIALARERWSDFKLRSNSAESRW